MIKKLSTISLLTLLTACSGNVETKDITPNDEIYNGYKIIGNKGIKGCGQKNINNVFIQVCDKITNELLNGVILDGWTDSENNKMLIEKYYKDGLQTEYIFYKNNIKIEHSKLEFDTKNWIENRTEELRFDNGNIQLKYKNTFDMINNILTSLDSTSYYINGQIKDYKKTDENKDIISEVYLPDGTFNYKVILPFINPNTVNKFDLLRENYQTYYDKDGNLFTGEIKEYYAKFPDKIEYITNIKNGKNNGIAINYGIKEEGDNVKTIETEYKDGIKIYMKATPWNPDTNSSNYEYYFKDSILRINKNPNKKYKTEIACRLKDINGDILYTEEMAEKIYNEFEKDKTKSPCEKLYMFKK